MQEILSIGLSINKDIECLVKTCDLCQEHSCRNNKDPAIPRDIPIQAWSMVQAWPYSHWMVSHFILVVDVTSRFPVVRILDSETMKWALVSLMH